MRKKYDPETRKEMQYKRQKAWYEKNKEHMREYRKARYEKLKADRLCVVCLKPMGDDPHCYCESCREYQKKVLKKRYHERKPVYEYIDTGCVPSGEYTPCEIPVYGCRFYDGEKLIKDYKPCKNAEGVEGMYDVITEEFLDRDSFVKMMLAHYMRADKVCVRTKEVYVG